MSLCHTGSDVGGRQIALTLSEKHHWPAFRLGLWGMLNVECYLSQVLQCDLTMARERFHSWWSLSWKLVCSRTLAHGHSSTNSFPQSDTVKYTSALQPDSWHIIPKILRLIMVVSSTCILLRWLMVATPGGSWGGAGPREARAEGESWNSQNLSFEILGSKED